MTIKTSGTRLAAVFALGLLSSCGGDGYNFCVECQVASKPSYVGAVATTNYDGSSDDLLTAGLGKSGAAPPPWAWPRAWAPRRRPGRSCRGPQ